MSRTRTLTFPHPDICFILIARVTLRSHIISICLHEILSLARLRCFYHTKTYHTRVLVCHR